jgi:cysteine desulfurase
LKKDLIYLDYNATSPLAESVKAYLAKGDFAFANPSSTHELGRRSKKVINDTSSYLLNTVFNLKDYGIVYTSGATESINTIFEGADALVYQTTDHPAVIEVANFLKKHGVLCHEISPLADGSINTEEFIKCIHSIKDKSNVWINFMYIHNESGVINSLDKAMKIKQSTSCKVHVDAVQSVCRFERWNELKRLDAYSFSAHKFGALKSTGFTLYKNDLQVRPIIFGGNQQDFRSGTMDPLSIKTIKLAMEDAISGTDYAKMISFKNEIKKIINSSENLEVIFDHQSTSCNTIVFIHKKEKADIIQSIFDMNGICLSRGSACSSSSIQESALLKESPYKQYSMNNLRLSISYQSLEVKEKVLSRLQSVVDKL